MKKFIYSMLFLGLFGISCSAVMAALPPSYPYYSCPSMEKFTTTLRVDSYCRSDKPLKPSEFSACIKRFNEIYNPARKEYYKRQCKLMDERFVQMSYGSAFCTAEFVAGDNPKILNIKVITTIRNSQDSTKCTDKLKRELKKAYPNITE